MLKITLELEANRLQKIEQKFLEELFIRFNKHFSNSRLVGLNQEKIIKFPIIWSWFKNWRFSKKEAKYIIQRWDELGFCIRIPYVGVKINDDGEVYG
ncbi:MAG: hypothetical protein CO092_01470 [Candidatus Aenigmarchaeota archaeon CG_4_9_14_3_um_filter_37_18]|nr:MAG: hypothetical protein COW21_00060 [Candidatus Aenigmarchaeota archaeon CG15_BIG_FIL_POST_REV_8_21_14_020_37_27]PJB75590.1 MAG: hypothetical protein CO092_01470 [Candidatus Aenigmarchaeota archaeon CG_4_9_14_3_um_filter_37_18]